MNKGRWSWSKDEIVLLKELWPNTLTSEIAESINRDEKSIMNKALNLGLERDTSKIINGKIRKTIIDLEKIDTEEKAYILGFSAADGSLVEKIGHSPVFSIRLHKRDTVHLKKLRDLICPEAIIYETKVDNCVGFRIGDLILARQLQSHGIIFRKTYNPQIPVTVPKHLLRHWIRGYFDGDGCITYNRKDVVCNFTAYSLTKENSLLAFIHGTFTTSNGCECPIKLYFSGERTLKLTYYGQKGICLLNYLYQDCRIYLGRKYELAKNYLGHRNEKQCKVYKKKTWTEQDVELLITNYQGMTYEQLENLLGHSIGAITSKVRRLGLENKKPRKNSILILPKDWSSEDEVFVINNYFTMRAKDIAQSLGRSLYSVRSEICRLQSEKKILVRKNRSWSTKELDFLLNNLGDLSRSEIARELGRTVQSVSGAMQKLRKSGLL